MAKLSPLAAVLDSVLTAVRVGIPTSCPCKLIKAPPLLPGLMAASVDGVRDGDSGRFGHAAVERTDDATGGCFSNAERVADRQHFLAYDEAGGAANLGHYHMRVGLNAHDGQVIGSD